MTDDLISRAASIRRFKKWINKDAKGDIANFHNRILENVIDALSEMPAASRWIPCSERLPKKVGDYLVTTHNGQITRYIYLGTATSKDYWMRYAAAWMPLPEPYKGE